MLLLLLLSVLGIVPYYYYYYYYYYYWKLSEDDFRRTFTHEFNGMLSAHNFDKLRIFMGKHFEPDFTYRYTDSTGFNNNNNNNNNSNNNCIIIIIIIVYMKWYLKKLSLEESKHL